MTEQPEPWWAAEARRKEARAASCRVALAKGPKALIAWLAAQTAEEAAERAEKQAAALALHREREAARLRAYRARKRGEQRAQVP